MTKKAKAAPAGMPTQHVYKGEVRINFNVPKAEEFTKVRPDLHALLKEWQPRMRLADWDLKIRYVPTLDGTGRSRSNPRLKCASIDILEPAYWAPNVWGEPDVERVLLHELGHVLFSPLEIPGDTPNDLHEEQIVEAYARALFDAKYALPREDDE